MPGLSILNLEPIIHGFYSLSDWNRGVHQQRITKLAEMDMAVADVLRVIDEALKTTPMARCRVLFALGNTTFRTGFNLASVHMMLLRRLQQKSIVLGMTNSTTPTPHQQQQQESVISGSSIPPSTFTSISRPELALAAAVTQSEVQDQGQGQGAKEEVVYKILYFKLHGMAATSRIMLALSGARWESIYPQDWTNEKTQTPFALMPILYESHPSPSLSKTGQQQELILEIPESEAIERYLARKFGFWGQDAWEETAIHVFYCSSKSVLSLYVNKVLLAFPDTKARELVKFVEKEVPAWIAQHEKWLGKSQTPGFYVGNQLSIADIHSVVCLDRFLTIPECKDLFSPEKTPNLFRLKRNLETYPRYTTWITSPEFEAINISTRQRLAVLKG
ncbi:hypothetical protein EC991_002382 [Linnemannia zychae]|nr:hypothetical protein EC991_002382 [Linnemannia zychae]